MITLATLSNLNEAFLLRSMLEASEIPAFIPDENTCQVDWGYINALGGVRVQIPEEFVSEATSVLNDFKNNPAGEAVDSVDLPSASRVAPKGDRGFGPSVPGKHVSDSMWVPLILIGLFVVVIGGVAVIVKYAEDGASALREANAAFSAGDYRRCIVEYTRALEFYPRNDHIYDRRSWAYCALGDYDHAIADATQALQLNPSDEYALRNRSRSYMDEGKYRSAITDATQCLGLDANDAASHCDRGSAYLALHAYDKAVADLSAAIQFAPENGKVDMIYLRRGSAYDGLNDFAKAIADYISAIRFNSQNEEAYNDWAWDLATASQAEMRDGKKAVECATRACALSGWKNGSYLDTLGSAYAEAGDFPNAIKWERAALEIPNQPTSVVVDDKKRLGLFEVGQAYHAEN